MDATLIAAVSAIAAALAAVGSLWKIREEHKRWAGEEESKRQLLSDERDRWYKERRAEYRVQFIHGLVENRCRTYPAVLMTLGVVRDWPESAHSEWLENNRPRLAEAADEILGHLYGEPGLFMSFQTRNQLLTARDRALEFSSGGGELKKLVRAFFVARRMLRQDLQLFDDIGDDSIPKVVYDLKGSEPNVKAA